MSRPMLPPAAQAPAPEEPQGSSFWDHLGELRRRLMYVAWCLLLGFVVAWVFREQLFQLATAPIYTSLAPYGIYRLLAIHTGEAMMVYVKLCFVADLMLVLPFSIYQLWAFVRPGLLPHEIRPIRRVVVLAMFFFVLGVLFCYRVVLPFLIDFMASFTVGSGDIDFQLTMDSAYSTTLNTMLMFGVIFELPLAMVMLTAMPFLTWRTYVKYFRYAVVLSFVVGAILTPPDVVSQILMSVPLVGLYGVGILLSWMLERSRAKGKPVRGVDWGLAVTILVMSAIMVPFVWPKPVDPAAALPTNLHAAVSVRGAAPASLDCPGLPRIDVPDTIDSLWICARYREGSLLVVQGTSAEWAAQRCEESAASPDATLRCHSDDRTVVLGPPFLVAAFQSRLDLGLSAASPLAQVTTPGTLLYVRPDLEQTDSPPYLLAFFPSEEEGVPHVTVQASSVAEAKGLSVLAEATAKRPATEVNLAPDPTREALLKLTAVVEKLSAAQPSDPETASALSQVRALLHAMPAPSAPSASPLACESVGCCLSALLPLLSTPDELLLVGKQLTFQVETPEPGSLASLKSLLLH